MTAAGGVLAMSVTLLDPKFKLATFPVGSTPPAWAQARITNPKAWAEAPEPTPEETPDEPAESPSPEPEGDGPAEATDPEGEDLLGELPEPPKRGAGSGREAWAAYATHKGVTFTDEDSRDDIIAALEKAAE